MRQSDESDIACKFMTMINKLDKIVEFELLKQRPHFLPTRALKSQLFQIDLYRHVLPDSRQISAEESRILAVLKSFSETGRPTQIALLQPIEITIEFVQIAKLLH